MRMRTAGVFVVGALLSIVACGDDDGGPSDNLDIEKPTLQSGDQQTGPAGQPLGDPLRVLITRDGEPVEGVDVEWSVGQGGSLGDEQVSDEEGIASVIWTLGPEVGEQEATAAVDGADGSPLDYTAIATPGGGPNGLAIGPDGKLYCCNNGGFNYVESNGYLAPHGIADDYSGGRIERIDIATGEVEILYKSGDHGVTLRGPNDLMFDAHGGFWFTDHGKVDYAARCHDIVGIFYAKADGSFIEEVIFPSNNPNGVGISPDGNTLYAAETYTCRLMKFHITAPGKVAADAGPGGPGIPLYRPAG